ncbi:DMT family transporter [Acuticoccus kandeliae]|uniref:DMT family transporter n=1 Tax=Acuticoccus kandeliae TaxID=2073160 RepID=UPI000D3E8DC2|nr:DMT family transporter [Acuticoccus kandeliae]
MQARGALAAVLSSALGGTAIGATRFLTMALDPVAMGVLRFGGGFIILAAIVAAARRTWPVRRDWPPIAALGVLFFCVFPLLFNAALIHTTAARGALALSTLPLLAVVIGAILGRERPTVQKTLGVLVAILGVATALGLGYADAPQGAWRGDLLMVAAAFCMALYSVLSRPFISQNGPLPFTTLGMGAGATCLCAMSLIFRPLPSMAALEPVQWAAVAYLAIVGGAIIFLLWAFALAHTTATVVTVSVAVNPVTATIYGHVLLGEPAGPNVAVGVVAVLCGVGLTYLGAVRERSGAARPRWREKHDDGPVLEGRTPRAE